MVPGMIFQVESDANKLGYLKHITKSLSKQSLTKLKKHAIEQHILLQYVFFVLKVLKQRHQLSNS